MPHYYGHALGDFRPGQRVRLHPATHLPMRGVRYADVVKVGRTRVWVRLDRAGRMAAIPADLLAIVED